MGSVGAAISSALLRDDAFQLIEECYRPIPTVYRWIAESHRALGEEELAQEADRRADTLPCTGGLDYFVLGEFQFHVQKQGEEALQSYLAALHPQPDHYPSLLAAGMRLRGLRQDAEAKAILTAAIAVNPQNITAYHERANLYSSAVFIGWGHQG